MTDITDDYRLFASAGGSEIDADIAIMTAYLARELSPVQRAAVERRLLTDTSFAKTVAPIIDAWKVPVDVPSDDALAGETMSAEELEAGWVRHHAATRSGERKAQRSRIAPLARAAAVVVLAAIPVVGLAQVALRWAQRAPAVAVPAAPPVAGPASVGDRQPSAGLVSVPGSRGAAVPAQQSLAQQSLPPIRDLALVEARPLTIPGGGRSWPPVIRPLPDGRVFLSDPRSRRLLLFDSTLGNPRVILDSAGNDPRMSYGTGLRTSGTPRLGGLRPPSSLGGNPRGGGGATSMGGITTTVLPNHGLLAPAWGDSTWFVNAAVSSLVLVGSDGGIGAIVGFDPGSAQGIDPRGTIVRLKDKRPGTSSTWFPETPQDSGALIRLPQSAIPETLSWLKVPVRMQHTGFANPMPVVDDWTILADGSVAIIRARDFHVDWIEPDGTRRSTSRIPFNWVRMTDAAKTALHDSAHAFNVAHPIPGVLVNTSSGYIPLTVTKVVPAELLPDSVPPFAEYTATSDLDLRVWIRVFAAGERPPTVGGTAGPLQTGFRPPPPTPVYYVIDKRGVVVERVRMPAGWSLLGVGARGIVFVSRNTGSDLEIARARIR